MAVFELPAPGGEIWPRKWPRERGAREMDSKTAMELYTVRGRTAGQTCGQQRNRQNPPPPPPPLPAEPLFLACCSRDHRAPARVWCSTVEPLTPAAVQHSLVWATHHECTQHGIAWPNRYASVANGMPVAPEQMLCIQLLTAHFNVYETASTMLVLKCTLRLAQAAAAHEFSAHCSGELTFDNVPS